MKNMKKNFGESLSFTLADVQLILALNRMLEEKIRVFEKINFTKIVTPKRTKSVTTALLMAFYLYPQPDPVTKTKRELYDMIQKEYLFRLGPEYEQYLKEGTVNVTLRTAFEKNGWPLSIEAKLIKDKARWKIEDRYNTYIIEESGTQLNIYTKGTQVSEKKMDKYLSNFVEGSLIERKKGEKELFAGWGDRAHEKESGRPPNKYEYASVKQLDPKIIAVLWVYGAFKEFKLKDARLELELWNTPNGRNLLRSIYKNTLQHQDEMALKYMLNLIDWVENMDEKNRMEFIESQKNAYERWAEEQTKEYKKLLGQYEEL